MAGQNDNAEKGHVVRCQSCPTLGSETGKIRPCVILTNDVYNQRVPITAWSAKKAKITTNVEINPTRCNGLSKKSAADCLQTCPIDHRHRLVSIRGKLTHSKMNEIDQALKIVFELS